MYQNNLLELHKITNKIPEIVIIEPLDSLEACSAIQALHQWKIVILKLSKLEFDQAQRVVDFIIGGTYAINGHSQLIGKQTFLFTPNFVQVINQSSVITV
ncbi:cell division protein SepF [Chlorogloea sp. CCALA 695]|uniref:cell division protein SepF n=1 Tax=Chlorogloea sp. CCALA 695 TaxID=2107693 RepID=UPI000D04EEEF|nr:cell division protein SepF [Chlorogloea sp. CCALA 695]PSB31335.1 hypothetical protein C7B70_13460 [Chlorogloea sp. CCALA 695]